MRRGLSLRWKLILGSVIVEVTMLALLVVNSVRLIETSLVEQAELRLKEVSVLLNAAVGPSLAAQDYGPILDVFSTSQREQGIAYLALWDNRGRLVALDGWPVAQPLPTPTPTKNIDISGNSLRFDTRISITVAGQPYGELQFGVSTRFLVEARSKLMQQSLTIAAIEVSLSVILLILLGIWLTRHLKKLEAASKAVSAGDYSVRLDVDSSDEIGSLAQAFNAMAAEIASRLRALRDSEVRYRNLSDLTSDWYWEQDENLRFTHFAGSNFREFPDLAKTLIGKQRWESDLIVISPQAMAAHRATVEAHLPFRDFEYKTISANSSAKYLSISGNPVFDESGIFTGYRGTGSDITVRKEAEAAMLESEQKFASLFQISPLPLALTDLSTGLLSDVNESWSKLFGYSHDEAISRSLEFLHLFKYENERRAFENLIARYGRCDLVEAHLARRDGTIINSELAGRMLEIGQRRFFVWCVRDVTHQRRVEAQIRDLNTQLEKRVAERTHKLQQTLETLSRAQNELISSEKLAALGRVVAAVAHELNTPIGNSVMVATTLDEKAREFAAQVEGGSIRRSQINEYITASCAGTDMLMRNLQQAHNLIHSFKQVAVDQTSDRRREFELKTMMGEILATLAPTLRKTPYHLSLNIADGLVMSSYPGPLGQVVTNFVNNALLHGFDGLPEGEMHLFAQDKPDSGFIELRFSDNGHGMDAEHLKHIFDPFFTTRLGQGGSGLGLNIVYNLVTRILGGSIDVGSTQGAGTTFTLYLPKVAPEQAADQSE
ncbi:MAG: sensor histidine kinase [Pseudomonadota bacterium]|nr:sensor histidine kinase [Pseudomonadota bacterium]